MTSATQNVETTTLPRSTLPREHPLRYALTNELHARPFEMLTPPVQVSMYACLSDKDGQTAVRAHLALLCERYGINPPTREMSHFSADFGPFRLRFEQHTEFTSYTVIRHGYFEHCFDKPASTYVPQDWLEALPGQLLVATHLAVLPVEGEPPGPLELEQLFVPESLASSKISGGSAQVWSDFRIHGDGHNRILLKPGDLPPPKGGRVVQRLLEIGAYRNFALLALPVAQEIGPELASIDSGLATLTAETAALVEAGTEGSAEREAELLIQLMQHSAEIERLNSRHSYRFSAARAYFALVQSRLDELREERQEDYQTLHEFLDRRLAPAMRTCESVESRLADMSRRATRAANLLRTRVDFKLERQNQGLLGSMDKRAKLQLRLQETVEGLSVAAITYYSVGLVGYAATALKTAGFPLDPYTVQGIAVPVIGLSVWAGLRRVRRRLDRED